MTAKLYLKDGVAGITYLLTTNTYITALKLRQHFFRF